MPAIPTRTVTRRDDGSACTINESDFNAEIYTATGAKPARKSRKSLRSASLSKGTSATFDGKVG